MKLLKKDLNKEFKIVEIFRTVEGEGSWVGLPVVFIRLEGCNLRCPWCDTTYSYDGKSFKILGLDQILNEIKKYNIKRVCITGGEPFFTENLDILVNFLLENKYTVFIETNGTLFNENIDYNNKNLYIVCSPKPPSYFINPNLVPYISEFKFVIDDFITLQNIKEVIKFNKNIILQPQSNLPDKVKKAIDLQDKLLSFGIESRVIPQCHKILGLP